MIVRLGVSTLRSMGRIPKDINREETKGKQRMNGSNIEIPIRCGHHRPVDSLPSRS